MIPGDTIEYLGLEYYVEKMELRGFGPSATIWAHLTSHEGTGKKRRLTHQDWVRVSEIEEQERTALGEALPE